MVASDLLARLKALPCGRVLLDAVGGTGADGGGEPLPGVHLVGGAVRDLVLGRKPRELDVVVEGDVDPVAERLGARLREHDRFGTVTVESRGCRFDLVRARAEVYPEPGALPDVTPASLRDDLERRDVTINAIALALPSGLLTAVPRALDDLRDGWLRVLHDASFADDPTRLWRVARYAARLGFAVDPHTVTLAHAADPTTVSGARMGNEIRLALAEPDPTAVFDIAHSLNARLLPHGFTTRPPGLSDALSLLPPEGRRDLVILAACVGAIPPAELLAWLHRLEFTAAERDVVAAGSRPSTWRPLREARTPAQVARAARGAPIEVVALAGGDNARRWIEDLRHVGLEIDGRDLLSAGIPEGPEVGRRLQAALDLKLDGKLAGGGRDAELAAALAA
jgi:tRNA nucleotidyltransferase (CCA-adding enzyme)